MIFDIDSHFEPGDNWLDPYPDLAARLPNLETGITAVEGVAGDLLRHVPDAERPSLEELMPPGLLTLYAQEKSDESDRRAEFEGHNQFEIANAAARVQWLDDQGIDIQNVICLSGMGYGVALEDRDPPLLREAVRACNSWLADTCDPAEGRLLPVTTLDCSDLDWAIEELTRMRERGSRIFLIPGHPVGGVPPCHPEWDRLWAAATDLAMTPMLHVGFERTAFDPGWANLGTNVTQLRQFASSHLHVGAQTLVSAFIFNGVFERHPSLTLLLAELGVGWLPWFYRQIDGRITPTSELFLGKWEYPLKPSEYLARNVRGTPLSWEADQPIAKVIDELPDEMIVFSSDFPHFEGFVDPLGYYREALQDTSEERRTRFFGAEMQAVFARMGDPIA